MLFSNRLLLLFALLITPGNSPHVSRAKADDTRRRGNAAEEEKRRTSMRRGNSPSPVPSFVSIDSMEEDYFRQEGRSTNASPVPSVQSQNISTLDVEEELSLFAPNRKRKINENAQQRKEKLKMEAANRRAARDRKADEKRAEERRKHAERMRLAREKETTPQREARLKEQKNRTAQNLSKESSEARQARLETKRENTTNRRNQETPKERSIRQAADVARKQKDIQQIRDQDKLRHKLRRDEMRAEQSSDSEDERDDIQPPKFMQALDIGPRNPCKYCGALLYGKELYCCSAGSLYCYIEKNSSNKN